MEKIDLWYVIVNSGDGEAYLRFYLTKKRARQAEDNQREGWGGSCVGSIQSYMGSKEYFYAVENETTPDEEF